MGYHSFTMVRLRIGLHPVPRWVSALDLLHQSWRVEKIDKIKELLHVNVVKFGHSVLPNIETLTLLTLTLSLSCYVRNSIFFFVGPYYFYLVCTFCIIFTINIIYTSMLTTHLLLCYRVTVNVRHMAHFRSYTHSD